MTPGGMLRHSEACWKIGTNRTRFTHVFKSPVDKPAVDSLEPQVLSLADCRKLLAAAREYKDGLLLPNTVLSLFADLRPAALSVA